MLSVKKKAALSNYIFGQSQNIFFIINGIILVPLYLTYVPLDLYGAWLASGNLISWLTAFESGVGVVLTQRLASSLAENRKEEYAKFVFSGISIIGIISIVISIAGILIAPYISVWFKIDKTFVKDLEMSFVLASIAAGLATLGSTLGALPQACLRTVGMGFVNLFAVIVGLGVTALAITSGIGVTGFGLGLVVKSGLQCLGLFILNFFHWRLLQLPVPRWSALAAKNLWNDSAPMFLARLSRSIGENSQTVISASIISPSASAILVLSSRLVLAVKMVVGLISPATFGGVASSFAEGNIYSIASTFRQVNIVTSVLLALGLSFVLVFNQPLVSLWVGPDKYVGEALNSLIVVAALIEVIVNSNSTMLQAMGRFRSTAFLEVIGMIFRIGLTILLGSYFGLVGLVTGGLVSVFIVNMFALPKLVSSVLGIKYRSAILSIIGDVKSLVICIIVSFGWRAIVPLPMSWPHFIFQSSIFIFLLLSFIFIRRRYFLQKDIAF